MENKDSDIVPRVRKLLTSVDIADDKIIFGNTVAAAVKLKFSILWGFLPFSKDTVCKNGATTNPDGSEEVILSDEQLNEFEREHRKALTEGVEIKKPFCHSLEEMSPKDLFALGNQVNRISTRTAKGRCACPVCHGTKKVNCSSCSGYGVILCPSCQGKEGGCQRCNKTGFIDCPSCHKQKKVACKKCKTTGIVTIERRVGLLAKSYPDLSFEFDRAESCFDIPNVKIQRDCYDDILGEVEFHLVDAEFTENSAFRLDFTGHTVVHYVSFCIAGHDTTYNYMVCGENFRPMSIPPLLDDIYAPMKARLNQIAVKETGALKIDNKISLFNQLSQDRFFHALLKSYESNFDAVTRKLKLETASNSAYITKRFSLKSKLESIVAVRKDEVADIMANNLISSTRFLMSHDFAKEMAMAVIEFIHCLKYRSRRVAKVWDFVTLGAWFVTLLLMFFAINPATMIICVVAGIITCVVNSLIGTKILKLYETIKYTRTLMNISRFIDFNYEIMRALVLLAGIVIIEFVVLNLK